MNHWYFYPLSPIKEAFDTRPFKTAKSVKHILELLVALNKQIRGQFVLKGTKKDYSKFKEIIQFEAHDCLYIDYNNIVELEQFLKIIDFNEEQIDRIIVYTIGYFHK